MKKSSLVAASVAAASASAVSASSSSKFNFPQQQDGYTRKMNESSSSNGSSASDKFAPRFDGLRFIETLVTAHR